VTDIPFKYADEQFTSTGPTQAPTPFAVIDISAKTASAARAPFPPSRTRTPWQAACGPAELDEPRQAPPRARPDRLRATGSKFVRSAAGSRSSSSPTCKGLSAAMPTNRSTETTTSASSSPRSARPTHFAGPIRSRQLRRTRPAAFAFDRQQLREPPGRCHEGAAGQRP
jgi:hypothetical protein